MAKGYRAVMTDNMGMMGRMKGTLDGKKMEWESMDEMKVPGHAVEGAGHRRRHRSEAREDDLRGLMNGKWMPTGSGTFKCAGGK